MIEGDLRDVVVEIHVVAVRDDLDLLGLCRRRVDGLGERPGLGVLAGDQIDRARGDLPDVVQKPQLHEGEIAGCREAAPRVGVMASPETIVTEELSGHGVGELVRDPLGDLGREAVDDLR